MPRGSRPGERRGGRQKGTPNKATEEIKSFARKYGKEAIDKAVEMMRSAESEQARMSAINTILDRAYGKPAQAHTGEGGEGSVKLEISWQAFDE